MTTQTRKQLINWASLLWALIALAVWVQGYDLTKLGLSEKWVELIQFSAAGILVLLQSIKPRTTEVEETTVTKN